MNRRKKILIWSFIISACMPALLSAQDAQLNTQNVSGERLDLCSDRKMYVVSEQIYFTVNYQKPEQIVALETFTESFEEKTVWDGSKFVTAKVPVGKGSNAKTADGRKPVIDWSTIVYIELIKWDGAKIAQAVSPVENGLAHGSLRIPSDLVSGNYYLRAYTKWMRNFSPYYYTYLPVKVINPYTNLIETGQNSGKNHQRSQARLEEVKTDGLSVSDLQSSYRKREEVKLDINLNGKGIQGKYCISVAKMNEGDPIEKSFNFRNGQGSSEGRIEYLPEINGLSLSGKIINAETGEPAANKKVNLSSFANTQLFSAVLSDEEGRFIFTLPHDAVSHELHIAEESDSTESYELLITSEFCNQPLLLPYIPFALDDKEKSVAEQLIRNAQLTDRFQEKKSDEEAMEKKMVSFFGPPTAVTYVDEYIELKDLREFFYELVKHVSVDYKNRKPYLSIPGQARFSAYPPLVLLDNVPVPNDEILLEIPSRRIDRIEVVNSGYIIGGFVYSGIISIFSRNKDMAGLDPVTDSHFFQYQLLDKGTFAAPEFSSDIEETLVPDRRNLLYWNPGIDLTQTETVKISFLTSDAPGDYVLTVKQMGSDNKAVVFQQKFVVE